MTWHISMYFRAGDIDNAHAAGEHAHPVDPGWQFADHGALPGLRADGPLHHPRIPLHHEPARPQRHRLQGVALGHPWTRLLPNVTRAMGTCCFARSLPVCILWDLHVLLPCETRQHSPNMCRWLQPDLKSSELQYGEGDIGSTHHGCESSSYHLCQQQQPHDELHGGRSGRALKP